MRPLEDSLFCRNLCGAETFQEERAKRNPTLHSFSGRASARKGKYDPYLPRVSFAPARGRPAGRSWHPSRKAKDLPSAHDRLTLPGRRFQKPPRRLSGCARLQTLPQLHPEVRLPPGGEPPLALRSELTHKTYRHGGYREFVVTDSKKRVIKAAPFRDRVVHHALCNVIEPILDQGFIHDSYACRRGKGTRAAALRLEHFMRSLKSAASERERERERERE